MKFVIRSAWRLLHALCQRCGVLVLRAVVITGLLLLPLRVGAVEDPPGCSLANGGTGNNSQGAINFILAQAHVGDTVSVFPSLGMAANACKAINATGVVYLATGPLTNFLVDVVLNPGVLVGCPAHTNCQPGPYEFTITADLVGAPVNTPLINLAGTPGQVKAVENGFGTVQVGDIPEQLSDFHSASIRIVTPCLQVFKTCDLPPGQTCFSAATPVRFRGSVTNCGDITLTNVTVVDGRGGQMLLLNPTNGLPLASPFSLAPGAYAVFSNSFTPTLAETCAGRATNSLTATATDTTAIGGPRASVTNTYADACEICINPAIAVTRTCPPDAVAPGGVLTFSGMVTNSGNLTLTNVTVVSDRPLTNGGNLVANFPVLTNGESRTFSGSYLVPTNTCAITDTLTAQGNPLCGPAAVTATVTTSCAVTNTPRLTLTLECPATPPAPGQLLLFTGNVTNSGDVVVTNIVLVNHQPTNNFPVAVVTRLEPGEGANYSGSYVVPTNGCTLTNTATATGFDLCGTLVTINVTRTCAVTNPPPTITCATNRTVEAGTGWTFDPPTAQDGFGDTNVTITVVNTQTNLSCVDAFTATRTWRATEACGSFRECSQTVTVLDKTPPVINCPANLVLTMDAGRCSRSNVSFVVTATDNCGVTNLVSSPSSGSSFPPGTTVVTNTATDANGNQSSCTFTVTVTDNQNPVITCSSNLVLTADAGRCDRSNVTFIVSATDNCNVTNLTSSPPSGSSFPVGVTTVTSTATDASGNQSSCTFTVTVTDNQSPVITCPTNLVFSADTGQCGRSNVIFTVSATDNCGVTNLVSSPPSGSTFPVGVTTVTSTATDASGNQSSCTFTVTVTDDESPVITCPANLVLTTELGRCDRRNVTFNVSALDNCGVTNLVSSPPSGSTFPLGTTTVTNLATDASGNQSSCSFTVTVTDQEQPVVTCPSNLVLTADLGRCDRSNVTFSVSATDNCSVTNLVSSPPSGSAFPVGVTIVTSTATDASGNTGSCTFTVTVTDTQNPVITCSSNLVFTADAGRCSRSNLTFTVSATDNCSVTNLVSSPPSGSTFPVGVMTVTSTATDASGNQSSCTFTVTVTDDENPVITCPTNLVLTTEAGRCDRRNVTFTLSATDNCGVTNLVSSPPSGSTLPLGTTTVTNTATDASGNQSSCSFTVTVKDNENPVVNCLSNLVLSADAGSCSRSNVTFSVSATDNCSVTNRVSSPPSGSTFPVGVTTVTNTATDGSGNQSSCTFTVTVTDDQSPVITCSSNLVFTADASRCSRSNVTFTVSAMDNCSLTNLVSSPTNGSTFPVGVTTVMSTATDASGNTSSCSFTVTVTDQENPVITCPSNLVLTTDAGQCSRGNVTFTVSATDNCSVTNVVSSPPGGSTFPLGTTVVTNTATDASGNQSSCSFTVTVMDTENPVVNCPSNLVLPADPGSCHRSNVTFAATATDNCSVTNVVSSPPSGSTFPPGTTIVTNTATDASGNQSSCTFTVTVTDNQNPVILCSSNLEFTADAGQCSRSNVTFTVSATDNCSVTNLVSSPTNGSTFPVGVTTVTSTATDASGNQSSCTFSVTVTDDENPVITCPTNVVLTTEAGRCDRRNVTFTLSATDNCGVTNLDSSPPSGSTFLLGTTVVTNTATDASGNQSTCSFTVTVTDNEGPVLICPDNLVVTTDAGRCSRSNVTFTVSAMDNCSVTNLVSSPPSGSMFPIGVTIVTNTATDASGNQSGCTFTVTVADTQLPTLTCPTNLLLTAEPGRCIRSNVTFTVSATDNCSVTNLVSNPPSGSIFPVGVTTVTNTATDASGNQNRCTFTVTVADTQVPVITCSSNLVLPADAGRCSRSNVTFAASATDNCSVTNLVSSPPSGSTFLVGTTIVTNTATDASGNRSSCTFTVTVSDFQPPAIICPPDVTAYLPAGQVAATNLALGTPSPADNCAVAGVSNNAPTLLPLGTNLVRWTVIDGSGNTNACVQRVVVRACSGIFSATLLTGQTNCPNQPVVFSTTANSPEPITYKWRFNGQLIPGQTNSSLALPYAGASEAGTYSVEVRTPCDAVTNSAPLVVLPGPGGSPASYTNSAGIDIIDSGPANPYVSLVPPQCVPGVVRKLTVHLFGFTHLFPSDVSVVLISPDGRQIKLMAGAGGGEGLSGAGVNLTFSDAAPDRLPASERIVTGTYRPTDYLPDAPPLPSPANGPYATSLAAFIGADANGAWSLCVFDGSSLDGGRISSWSLALDWREKNLMLRNPTVLANGEFQVEVLGQTDIPTILERSSNFVTWLPVATNVFAVNPGVFLDPAPLAPYHFYRAVQP